MARPPTCLPASAAALSHTACTKHTNPASDCPPPAATQWAVQWPTLQRLVLVTFSTLMAEQTLEEEAALILEDTQLAKRLLRQVWLGPRAASSACAFLLAALISTDAGMLAAWAGGARVQPRFLS